MSDDKPKHGADAGGTTFATNVQGSTLAAHAQGPGARAVGIVNQFGLGYADVTQIVDERLAAAAERLREGVGLAHRRSTEDMLQVSFAVVQSLVAAKLGAPPDAASVAEFLREVVEDPAFPARAARLFQEGAKTPSTARREMLARALFGIPASTPERDRIDVAIERLFPEDVLLLGDLVALLVKANHERSIVLVKFGDPAVIYAVLHGDEKAIPTAVDHVVCSAWPLHSLHVAGCVNFGPWITGAGPDRAYAGTDLAVLPLGDAVLHALVHAGRQRGE